MAEEDQELAEYEIWQAENYEWGQQTYPIDVWRHLHPQLKTLALKVCEFRIAYWCKDTPDEVEEVLTELYEQAVVLLGDDPLI